MNRIKLTLRVYGSSVVPNQITERVGIGPTESFCNGDPMGPHASRSGLKRKHGLWSYCVEESDPALFSQRIRELLQLIPEDAIKIDRDSKVKVDLFVGMFGVRDQSSFELSADVLSNLGQRGWPLIFDLYT